MARRVFPCHQSTFSKCLIVCESLLEPNQLVQNSFLNNLALKHFIIQAHIGGTMTTLNVDLKTVKQVKGLNSFVPPKFILTLEKWGYGLTMFGFT
jgi:hypothetical protein